MSPRPARGDVWLADLDPVRGHEQAGIRPVVIVSTDRLNRGASGRVVVVPMTSSLRRAAWHVQVLPPDGGVRQPSLVKCEDPRSVSVERLISYWGRLSVGRLGEIAVRLRTLLEI